MVSACASILGVWIVMFFVLTRIHIICCPAIEWRAVVLSVDVRGDVDWASIYESNDRFYNMLDDAFVRVEPTLPRPLRIMNVGPGCRPS
jgi:hypothetical protein